MCANPKERLSRSFALPNVDIRFCLGQSASEEVANCSPTAHNQQQDITHRKLTAQFQRFHISVMEPNSSVKTLFSQSQFFLDSEV